MCAAKYSNCEACPRDESSLSSSVGARARKQQTDSKCTCQEEAGIGGGGGGGVVGLNAADIKVKNVTKRDMATSPNLGPKSPKIVVATSNMSAKLSVQAAPKSPTVKSRTTRSAATSPRLELKQKLNNLSSPEDSSLAGALLTSNGDWPVASSERNKLKTTRSLSPRPPIKHQHAILVCDENDVVSVKLSPNEDLVAAAPVVDEDRVSQQTTTRLRKKCQSEHASPNIFEDSRFLYGNDQVIATNRSTGCLVYVPSDPWLRMSDEELKIKELVAQPTATTTTTKKKVPTKFDFTQAKSKSRPNILDYDDPWIWKGEVGQQQRVENPSRQALYRQSRSLQSKSIEQDAATFKLSQAPKGKPRLQRSKVQLMDMPPGVVAAATTSSPAKYNVTAANNTSSSVQHLSSAHLLQSSSSTNINSNSNSNNTNCNTSNTSSTTPATLSVNNTNWLLQPRHSFSYTQQPRSADDELQLNIRRLSEQQLRSMPLGQMMPSSPRVSTMSRHGNNNSNSICANAVIDFETNTWTPRSLGASGGGGSGNVITRRQHRMMSPKTPEKKQPPPEVDPLLETTC